MKHSNLTPAQRAKIRKIEKTHEEATRPISQALYKREEEVRRQSWAELNCADRIKALEAEYFPQMQELENQRKAIAKQYQELSDKLSELRLDIQSEPYQAVYVDAQHLAMKAVYKQIREAHEAKLTELIAGFEQANAEKVGA